jgi:hypothetical protein
MPRKKTIKEIITSVINSVKTYFEQNYGHFRLVVCKDSITVHNHFSDFDSKVDLEGECLNMNSIAVAFSIDFEINHDLNRMANIFNNMAEDDNVPLSAAVLEPGNVLSIQPNNTNTQTNVQPDMLDEKDIIKNEKDVIKNEKDVIKNEKDVIKDDIKDITNSDSKDEKDVIKNEKDVIKNEKDIIKDDIKDITNSDSKDEKDEKKNKVNHNKKEQNKEENKMDTETNKTFYKSGKCVIL